jgi:cytochrome P450
LEWVILELVRNVKILALATKELDRVVGPSRLVTERDILDLLYMKAIVKKTMPMQPVAPLLAPRKFLEDVSIELYDIPDGTRMLVNMWAIALDNALWDTPNEFQLEQFLGGARLMLWGRTLSFYRLKRVGGCAVATT